MNGRYTDYYLNSDIKQFNTHITKINSDITYFVKLSMLKIAVGIFERERSHILQLLVTY